MFRHDAQSLTLARHAIASLTPFTKLYNPTQLMDVTVKNTIHLSIKF
ncbi:MAG TPA: hypothetical protein V6C91_21910 [Coleofasciculaceae cyanobacterium]